LVPLFAETFKKQVLWVNLCNHCSTTRREILAVVYCFQRFSKWLVNKHFTLHVDHRSIIGHRGTPGNYNYLVHWLGYDNPEDNTWQTEQDFDSKYHIQLYWDRRNAGDNSNRSLPVSVNNATRKRGTRDRHSNKNANVIRRSQRTSGNRN
ncbi:hypothetical protein HPULCUR_012054, partial [Helicostylum pulchrum]